MFWSQVLCCCVVMGVDVEMMMMTMMMVGSIGQEPGWSLGNGFSG